MFLSISITRKSLVAATVALAAMSASVMGAAPAQAQEREILPFGVPVAGTGPLGISRGQTARLSIAALNFKRIIEEPILFSEVRTEEPPYAFLVLRDFLTGDILATRPWISPVNGVAVDVSVTGGGAVLVNGEPINRTLSAGGRIEVTGIVLLVPRIEIMYIDSIVQFLGSLQVIDSRGQTITALPAVQFPHRELFITPIESEIR